MAARGGYDTRARIVEELVELVEYDPETKSLVAADRGAGVETVELLVDEAFRAHAADEALFPPVTDCDRVSATFVALKAAGVLAAEDVGVTMSDLRYDMTEALGASRAEGEDLRGWAAFHRQDVDRVVDSGVLIIAFSAAEPSDEADRTIGAAVSAALLDAGFAVDWPNNPDRRIEVKGLSWQKRRNSKPA